MLSASTLIIKLIKFNYQLSEAGMCEVSSLGINLNFNEGLRLGLWKQNKALAVGLRWENHEGWNIDDSRIWVFKQFAYAEIVL